MAHRSYVGVQLSPSGASVAPSVRMEPDPEATRQKHKEKQDIQNLNDKFVNFIDKVRNLEQQNKVLETRLKILLEQDAYKGNIEDIVAELKSTLKNQVDVIALDKKKMENELVQAQDQVEFYRRKYEDEIQKKTDLENDFVIAKKEVDDNYLQKVSLDLDLDDIEGELEFLKRAYAEEIKELQSQIHNTKVVLALDNGRDLDMKEVVQNVKTQYDTMAARGRQEAEQWHQKKMDDMAKKAQKHEQDVKNVRKEVSESLRLIQKLTAELESLKKQREALEESIRKARREGEGVCQDALARIRELEEALNQAKADMAGQLREYQELMNLKLALDIEIATYKKLLEGEENRLALQGVNPPRRY